MNKVLGLCMVVMLGLAGCAGVADDLEAQKRDEGSRAAVLTNLQVVDAAQDFSGEFTVTSLRYRGGQLLVNGVLTYVDQGKTVTQKLRRIPATLTGENPESAAGTTFQPTRRCGILFLDLGPLFLDVLGLQVDLSPVQLAIDAVSGPGNLLGNLLCSLTGLLDGGPLARILDLIDNINRILDSARA